MANLVVNDGNRYTVDPLFQWDIDQMLYIYGVSVLDPEIHFSNGDMAYSIVSTCSVDDSGVISVSIPNSLLQKPSEVKVYICGYEGTTFKTYYKMTIPVKTRPKPADYSLSVNDREVYSFNALSKKIADIENDINNSGSQSFYKYSYSDAAVNLVESQSVLPTLKYLPFVSSSLKAIKSITDKFRSMINANASAAEQALAIAKGRNRAHVFNTTEEMRIYLSDSAHIGEYNVGDNIYIIDLDVPDWWISEVLTEPDAETGYYYKLAHLETQKVDLSAIDDLRGDITDVVNMLSGQTVWTNPNLFSQFDPQTISLDLTAYKRIKIKWVYYMNSSWLTDPSSATLIYLETDCTQKGVTCLLQTFKQPNAEEGAYRTFSMSDIGVQFDQAYCNGSYWNYCIPAEIVGYKY